MVIDRRLEFMGRHSKLKNNNYDGLIKDVKRRSV